MPSQTADPPEKKGGGKKGKYPGLPETHPHLREPRTLPSSIEKERDGFFLATGGAENLKCWGGTKSSEKHTIS